MFSSVPNACRDHRPWPGLSWRSGKEGNWLCALLGRPLLAPFPHPATVPSPPWESRPLHSPQWLTAPGLARPSPSLPAEAHLQEAALRWRGASDGLLLSIPLPNEFQCRRPAEEQIYQVPKDINLKKVELEASKMNQEREVFCGMGAFQHQIFGFGCGSTLLKLCALWKFLPPPWNRISVTVKWLWSHWPTATRSREHACKR